MLRKLKLFFPFLDWLPTYDRQDFRGDLFAGLTIGVMLIPQGMAYATLANMPPIYGLYAALVPAIIYAISGTARQLSVGPVAIASLLVVTAIGDFAQNTEAYVEAAILLALMVGIMMLLFGIFRLGFLVNFLSRPVMMGFTMAASIIIISGQMKHLLGLSIGRQPYFHQTIQQLWQNLPDTNWLTVAIGSAGIVILLTIKKLSKLTPSHLIAMIIGIVCVYYFNWADKGVAIVGEIEAGLPSMMLPQWDLDAVRHLWSGALTIALIAYVQSIAVSKILYENHKNYRINPNQELAALGFSNIIGSFFQIFPVTGGFARSVVNDAAGARTPLAGVISSMMVGITLLFFTGLFYYLPKAILAAIIITAVAKLFNIPAARALYKTDQRDFWMMVATFIATLFIGIEEGILIGVSISLAMMIFHSTRPNIDELGRIPGTVHYRGIRRYKGLKTRKDVLILKFDAQIYFANVEYFRTQIDNYSLRKGDDLRLIILNAYAINHIDSTAISMLEELNTDLEKKNIELYFIGLTGQIRDDFKRNKIDKRFGKNHFFVSIEDALEYFDRKRRAKHQEYA